MELVPGLWENIKARKSLPKNKFLERLCRFGGP